MSFCYIILIVFVWCLTRRSLLVVRMGFPCVAEWPLIAGCLSLQRLGIYFPVTRPAWGSNLRHPASERRPITD